jgi:hypothetical protein
MDFRNLDAASWGSAFRSGYWGSAERAEAFLEMIRTMPNSIVDWRLAEDLFDGETVNVRGVLPMEDSSLLMVATKTHDRVDLYQLSLLLERKQITSLRVTSDFFEAVLETAGKAEQERAEKEEAEIKNLIGSLADMASGEKNRRIEVYMGGS